ncbi:MAG: HlyD family secretion protein [Planctomycetota bacterium]|jgi:multidrug resistance efflux pump
MKKTYSNSSRLGRFRQHAVPVFVWFCALACAIVLFQRRAQRFEVLGIAQGQVRQVAATCSGRLINVPVQLFQKVKEGDVVAIIDTVLDDENIEAQLATASAEIQHLQAQLTETESRLEVEATNLQTDRIASERRFYVDVEDARLRVLELKTQLETDRILLEQLELDMKVASARSVRDQNDTAYYEVQKAKLEQAALAKKVQENQRLLEQTEAGLNQAQQRRDEFAQRQPQYLSTDNTLEVLRRAIKVQELRVGELLARREPLVLKAPIDGVVSQILRRPVRRTGEGVVRQMIRRSGEAVTSGEPILTISGKEPSEIISYVSDEQLAWVRAGMTVQLVKETEPLQIAASKVTYLGPIMEVMPQRLWLVPNIPQWGRPMLIEIPPGMKLLPGEMVGIKGL